jgi:hypothetical protein
MQTIDSTGFYSARQTWELDPNNILLPYPNWDNNGNVIAFIAILFILTFVFTKLKKPSLGLI